MRPTKDGAYAGEFRLTGECGTKLLSLLHPLAKPRINSTRTDEGKLVEEPDPRSPRAADARRAARRVRPAAPHRQCASRTAVAPRPR